MLHSTSMTSELRPGFCEDTGVPSSVVGLPEMRRLFARMKNTSLVHSARKFRFANTTFSSVGRVQILLVTPSNVPPIPVFLDVPAGVPGLLDLDVADQHSLLPDTVTNVLPTEFF
eukprot:Plantae.Rhodophyta-Rhodochaete_pulchella.ctg14528.p1 GENE.Plantae.Rhodophyta-Rhodochaete_pulchella.ctg14528~~Plantae.Rhodophyta-Rhodochaete_pulchella.ctg14528.p1  ORF type:complete len:115 (+),score=7.20 Plantae.Rhodophyta-Rhodochaete_pulchella.ctg14528:136-480(+)